MIAMHGCSREMTRVRRVYVIPSRGEKVRVITESESSCQRDESEHTLIPLLHILFLFHHTSIEYRLDDS